MAYLEEKHIVHRDLAARNVLVHETGTAKVRLTPHETGTAKVRLTPHEIGTAKVRLGHN